MKRTGTGPLNCTIRKRFPTVAQETEEKVPEYRASPAVVSARLTRKWRRILRPSTTRLPTPHYVGELVVAQGWLDVPTLARCALVSRSWQKLAYRPSAIALSENLSIAGESAAVSDAAGDGNRCCVSASAGRGLDLTQFARTVESDDLLCFLFRERLSRKCSHMLLHDCRKISPMVVSYLALRHPSLTHFSFYSHLPTFTLMHEHPCLRVLPHRAGTQLMRVVDCDGSRYHFFRFSKVTFQFQRFLHATLANSRFSASRVKFIANETPKDIVRRFEAFFTDARTLGEDFRETWRPDGKAAVTIWIQSGGRMILVLYGTQSINQIPCAFVPIVSALESLR